MRGQALPEFVLGSVQLGLEYGAANRTGKPAREGAVRLLRHAQASGVAAFDTARSYGEAEERLGEAFGGGMDRIVTKLSPLSNLGSDAPADIVRNAVDASIRESLEALRRSRIATLLLHRASHLSAFHGAVWQRLLEYRANGIVERLGVSVQSPLEAHVALDVQAVAHIQLPFNILDWRWQDAGIIDRLRGRPDVTVHARSIFLQGILAASDPAVWPPIPDCDPLSLTTWIAQIAREFGRESAADLCLAYARGQDWIDGVVVGQETEYQLEANLRLMQRFALSPADCAAIAARRPPVPSRLLDPAQWPKR